MIKRIIAFAVAAVGFATFAHAADFRIMITLWNGCEEACQGFQDMLTEDGIDAEFLIRDADQDKSRLAGFVAEARESGVDLILSWGTSVTRGTAGTLDQLDDPSLNHDIPHIFTVVADPVGARIIESLDKTGRPNVTGTFNRVPERVSIDTIRIYDPDFEHLGLLFSTNENNSVLKRNELQALSEEMGFTFTALEMPLDDSGTPRVADIAPAVAQLKEAGVDFIYLGSSSFLDVNRDVFTGAAVENGIPVLSPYEHLVTNSQALISIAARDYDTGRLAGKMAKKILIGGATPGDLPVERMTDFAFVINISVARKLNLFPPIELLQAAETVE